jgi:hypothetical protein
MIPTELCYNMIYNYPFYMGVWDDDGTGAPGVELWFSPSNITAPATGVRVCYVIDDIWPGEEIPAIAAGAHFFVGWALLDALPVYSGWDYDYIPDDDAWWYPAAPPWLNVKAAYAFLGGFTHCAWLMTGVMAENDVGVTSVDDVPASGKSGDEVCPTITVKNFGTNDQASVTINFTPGGSVTIIDLLSEEERVVDWDPQCVELEDCGEVTFEACTDLSGDENPDNDCDDASVMVVGYDQSFEKDDGYFVGDGDWEWGMPTSGPGAAHTGDLLWATNLGGNYSTYACDKLYSALDATTDQYTATEDVPIMEYWHWYNIEGTYDGYNVKMSINGGPFAIIDPVGGYPYTYNWSSCIYNERCFSGSSDWTKKTFILSGVSAGDEFQILWTLSDDAIITYPGLYLDDVTFTCIEPPLPPPVDLDIDDDYANLGANKMELYGVKSKKGVESYTFGTFVVINPDEDLNPDYWDGPNMCGDFHDMAYSATDLYNYHHPKDKEKIPAGCVTFTGPSTLAHGDAALVVVGVLIPDKAKDMKHNQEEHRYRGTVTAEGFCEDTSATDEFTLTVGVVKGSPGTVLPNSFVGNLGEQGVVLSWGEFDFADYFNVYREDGLGDYTKLNEAPLSGNSSYLDEDIVANMAYQYKFGIILPSGREAVFGPMMVRPTRGPAYASLLTGAPNPLRTETAIRYAIAADAEVSLKIYDVTGALVKILVNESVEAGYHSVLWDGTNETGNTVANGVYFYRLTAGDFNQSRKLVVLR